MKGHGEKLSRKQEAAIVALMSCPTIAEAASKVGIGEATLWRWMQRPAFQRCYRAARGRVVEAAIGTLQQATTEAVAALQRNLTSGVPSVEVQAAKAILDQSTKAIELMDLVERVEYLEQASEKGRGHVAA